MGLFNVRGESVLTINEQKEYLHNRLELERLCFSENNKNDIEQFEQTTCGNKIAEYLKNKAWQDDEERNTKVYLVRDKNTKEIVYYFAINCGILYSEKETINPNENEKEVFERYIEASAYEPTGNYKSKMYVGAGYKEDIMKMLNDPEFAEKLVTTYAKLIDSLKD